MTRVTKDIWPHTYPKEELVTETPYQTLKDITLTPRLPHMLQINGIKENVDETNSELRKILMDLFGSLAINIPEKELAVCHRQGIKLVKTYNRPVRVSFRSEHWQKELLRQARKLKEKGLELEVEYQITRPVDIRRYTPSTHPDYMIKEWYIPCTPFMIREEQKIER